MGGAAGFIGIAAAWQTIEVLSRLAILGKVLTDVLGVLSSLFSFAPAGATELQGPCP
jgi:hypothetical protein